MFDMRHRRRDRPWIAFLWSLEPLDSFEVEYPMANTMMTYARDNGIPLIKVDTEKVGRNGRRLARIWMADEETWLKVTSGKLVLESPRTHANGT